MAITWTAYLTVHRHRNSHAPADAKRGETLLGVATRHFMQQRGQHPRARGADRMTERDGAAVDVDNSRVPAQVLVDRESLSGEGLVGFHELEVLDHQPAFSSAFRLAGIGPVPMIAGSTPAVAHDTIRAIGVSPRRFASAAS